MAETRDAELESLSDESGENERERLVLRTRRNINIRREPQNERHFEAGHSRVPKSRTIRHRLKEALPPEPVRSALTPPLTREAWLEFVLVHVPILRWLLSYQASFVISDLVSGITVAIMHIPQGLAYALLADLPPVYGLYASFMPPIIYSFFGSSRHVSVGTFAVVTLMIGNSINKILSQDPLLQGCLGNGPGNDTDFTSGHGSGLASGDGSMLPCGVGVMAPSNASVDCDAEKASIAITIALVSGVIMLLMGLFQLGFISIFLSESLVSGYTTGAAVLVFTSQLTHILGISNKVPPGLFQVPRTWTKSFSILPTTNLATLLISLVSIAALIGFKFLNKWLKKKTIPIVVYSRGQRKWCVKRVKWTIPIPAPLVVVSFQSSCFSFSLAYSGTSE
jgi:MFS superfamily sulfate permease-like transporter